MTDDFSPILAQELDWAEQRKAKGISLQEMSALTNISVKKIEALEQGRFSELVNSTFVTGYIRLYAKILQCDAQPFLEDFKRLVAATEKLPLEDSPVNLGHPRPGKTWGRVSIFNLSLVAVVIWWLMVLVFGGDEPRELSVQQPDTSEQPALESAESSDPLEMRTRENTELNEIEALATKSRNAMEASDLPAELPFPKAEINQADESQFATREDYGISEPGQDVLIMAFSEDCWVEVKEHDGRLLIAELKRKGDNLQLFGTAPFNVLLGKARSVELSINGKPVSTTPKGGRQTLRLVLDGK